MVQKVKYEILKKKMKFKQQQINLTMHEQSTHPPLYPRDMDWGGEKNRCYVQEKPDLATFKSLITVKRLKLSESEKIKNLRTTKIEMLEKKNHLWGLQRQ